MKSLLYLFIKFGSFVLLVTLQLICFYLIITFNKTQRETYLNTTNIFVSALNNRIDRFQNYLSLSEVNDQLRRENASLVQKIVDNDIKNRQASWDSTYIDSIQYRIIPVEICNATFHSKNNHLTLCSGTNKGIKKDMGVISNQGIIGVVKAVSDNFSLVISILNTQLRISAMIARDKTLGNLVWRGDEAKTMYLESVPKYVEVVLGDTIITSGYSTIFPPGIPIGIVTDVRDQGGSGNHLIKVDLFSDPRKNAYVYVIENRYAEEQLELERKL
jgi:rod shape-determining protein MreC